MSADYERLFHSPDAVRTVDEDADRDTPQAGRDIAALQGDASGNDATHPPMPIVAPRTRAAELSPPGQNEVTSQIPSTHGTDPERVPNNGMMRAPQDWKSVV